MQLFNKNLSKQIKRRQSGFSLIEVMITISIIAILTTISAHYFSELYKNYQSKQFITLFWQALKHQPKAAMGIQKDLVMLPINNSWLNGWQIFIDENQDQVFNNNDRMIEKASNYQVFSQFKVKGKNTPDILDGFKCFRFASGGIIRQCGNYSQLINQGTMQIFSINDDSCGSAYELVLFQNIPRICKLQGSNNNCQCSS